MKFIFLYLTRQLIIDMISAIRYDTLQSQNIRIFFIEAVTLSIIALGKIISRFCRISTGPFSSIFAVEF